MDVPVRKHRQWGGSVKEPEFAIGWMLSSSTMHNVLIVKFNDSSAAEKEEEASLVDLPKLTSLQKLDPLPMNQHAAI